MVPARESITVDNAAVDDSDQLTVEGELPAGLAVCLVPRRYRKRPEWWMVEVVGIDAPSSDAQQFRLSCSADGLWGTEGIEVSDTTSSLRIPRRRGARWIKGGPH